MPYGRLAKHEIPSSCLPLLPLNYYSATSLLIFDKAQLWFVFSESEQTIPVVCHTRHIISPRTGALESTAWWSDTICVLLQQTRCCIEARGYFCDLTHTYGTIPSASEHNIKCQSVPYTATEKVTEKQQLLGQLEVAMIFIQQIGGPILEHLDSGRRLNQAVVYTLNSDSTMVTT